MSGSLIAEYILREKKEKGELPENAAIVETIVTTDMLKAVAEKYGVKLIEVLTGFKFIGEQIKLFEQNNSYEYIFGMEESYGCLAGTYARDKDACVAVMMLCEVAAYYKLKGMTLCDAMQDMYKEYGYYKEGLFTITKKGIDGAEQIENIRQRLWVDLRCSKCVTTRVTKLRIWLQVRQARPDFQNQMYCIMNLKTTHGAVFVRQEQSLRLNSTMV